MLPRVVVVVALLPLELCLEFSLRNTPPLAAAAGGCETEVYTEARSRGGRVRRTVNFF